MNPIGSEDLANVLTQFDERKIEFKSEEESSFFRFHRELVFDD
jgi:hypothetical protein